MNFMKRQKETAERIDEHWQPRLYVRWLVLIALIAYVIAFVLENGKHVSVHFVFHTTRVSLIWVILLALGLGAIGGILLGQLERRRRRRGPDQ